MSDNFVAIIMGSDSDLPTMEKSLEVLTKLKIRFEVKVASAHRTPDEVCDYVTAAQERGAQVFICAAGMAAHLAGAVAARTIKPVIGVPCKGGLIDGVDALYSTVQMPGGIPVACVAVGNAGAKNAAYLAAQMLALSDERVAQALKNDREQAREAVITKDQQLQEQLMQRLNG